MTSLFGIILLISSFLLISNKNAKKTALLMDNIEAYTDDFGEDIAKSIIAYNSKTVTWTESTSTKQQKLSFWGNMAGMALNLVGVCSPCPWLGIAGILAQVAGNATGTDFCTTTNYRCCGDGCGTCQPFDGYHTDPLDCIEKGHNFMTKLGGW